MIGAFRHKVILLTEVLVADAGGGASSIWSESGRIWAQIERLASTQDFLGERRRRLKRIAATIRNRADIATGARLMVDGDRFEITSIEDGDDRGRRLVLICEEVAS